MSKETLHVSIFDETYSLVTDESEAHLNQAAQMVDQKMREIARAGVSDVHKIAVLVSLQLASKLLLESKASQEYKQTHDTVNQWLKEQDKALSDLI